MALLLIPFYMRSNKASEGELGAQVYTACTEVGRKCHLVVSNPLLSPLHQWDLPFSSTWPSLDRSQVSTEDHTEWALQLH